MDDKKRLDILLAEISGYSREFSKELIQKSCVRVDGKTVTKAGEKINTSSIIQYDEPKTKYVSRGGYKLEKALREFNINLQGKVCLDIGASTGGFTDCMLQHGAKKVFAVDSGTNQLSHKLKVLQNVISFEKTNIRDLPHDFFENNFNENIQFICVDVSFVSLTKILEHVFKFFSKETQGVFLIKPQFEAGRQYINKKGIVKDTKIHKKVVDNITEFSKNLGFHSSNTIQSPITGSDGNIEYLIFFDKKGGI